MKWDNTQRDFVLTLIIIFIISIIIGLFRSVMTGEWFNLFNWFVVGLFQYFSTIFIISLISCILDRRRTRQGVPESSIPRSFRVFYYVYGIVFVYFIACFIFLAVEEGIRRMFVRGGIFNGWVAFFLLLGWNIINLKLDWLLSMLRIDGKYGHIYGSKYASDEYKFHLPPCGAKGGRYEEYYCTVQEALDDEKKPCEECLPELYELINRRYVADKSSQTFHLTHGGFCNLVRKIRFQDKIFFRTFQEAIDSGRQPCAMCKPSVYHDE